MMEALKLIGNTPMIQLDHKNIFVKLEKFNLGGSIKDRTVLGMIQVAMKEHKINENSVLVEATSGNTGIALAMIGAVYHLKVIIIMPETMSIERRQLVKAYGAELILSPGNKGMNGAIAMMQQLLDENKDYVSLKQFENKANALIHYETTGVEILKQVPNIDMFVACVGTGGSFSGIAKRLKEQNHAIRTIVGEPSESAVLSGMASGPHKIQGIGAGFIPEVLDRELIDDVMLIDSDEAIKETINFVKETGILVGISSGANIALAKRLSERYPDKNIVTLAPDGGEKYLSVLPLGDNQ
ncbi:MAG: cysteine synthase A [Erysipelotrichaceae bacterium]